MNSEIPLAVAQRKARHRLPVAKYNGMATQRLDSGGDGDGDRDGDGDGKGDGDGDC